MRSKKLQDIWREDFQGRLLDTSRWTTDVGWVKGDVRVAGGAACIRAATAKDPGPGVMAFSGFATRERVFNPGLAGTSVLEVTLENAVMDGELLNRGLSSDGAAADHEDADTGTYLMGFCLTIGSFRGMVGSEPDRARDRAVQIHFDWWKRAGLWFPLNRNIVPALDDRYRLWDPVKDGAAIREGRGIDCPVRTLPGNAIVLAWQHNPMGDGLPGGHRYGLVVAGGGDTLSWTLDGRVMNTVGIQGFFKSSPGCVDAGAYASLVGGGSFRENTWTVRDVRVAASLV